MLQAPPALLVAQLAAVEESIANEIADKPSPETRRSYEHVWRFYRAWLAAQPLEATAVRPKHIQAYIASLRLKGQKKGTIGRALSAIRTLYGRLVCDELMLTNPACVVGIDFTHEERMNLEIFPCSGGMSEGFRRAGIEFDMAIDYDPNACESHEKNLGLRPLQMDVRDFLRMARLGWRPADGVRLLVADPPCTPWSRAGKRKGLEDERDMLRETAEIIALLRPDFYLIGNVPGLQDSTSWGAVQDVIGGMAKHGYCVADYAQFDAADYGVPQHRVRPFWFGHRKGTPCIRWPQATHAAPSDQPSLLGMTALEPWVTCRQALQHLPLEELGRPVRMKVREVNGKDGGDESRCSAPDGVAGTVVAAPGRKGGQILIPSDKHPPATPDGLSPTIRGSGHSAPQVVLARSRHDEPVHTSDADSPARALTTQCRAPGHASTVVFNDRHPPATPDSPAGTIGAKDRGQSTVLAVGPADGRGTDIRHPSSGADEPSRTIKTNTERVGSGGALAWPWDRPSTVVYADERITPPGHHSGSMLTSPNAIVLSERAVAILQGFPDGWVFAGETKKARWSQIGMAMPPPLAHAVARAVREAMERAGKVEAA